MGFTNSIIPQSLLSERTLTHPTPNILVKSWLQPQQVNKKNAHYGRRMKKSIETNPWNLSAIPPTDSTFNTSLHSPAQTIRQFYSAVNDRNLKQIKKLIAEDCTFEDHTFSKPFQGKKVVLRFLQELVLCMGQNMQFKFNIEHVCEGNNHTATVNWHIDWNRTPIPFSKGCSFYAFSVDGNELVIKKAQVFVESPIKLGLVALTTFKIISSAFDAFPQASEWFLKRSYILFYLLLFGFGMALGIAIKPMISPVLAWYIRLRSSTERMVRFIHNLFYYIKRFVPM